MLSGSCMSTCSYQEQLQAMGAKGGLKHHDVQVLREYLLASRGQQQQQPPGMQNTGVASSFNWSVPEELVLKKVAKFTRGCNLEQMERKLRDIAAIQDVVHIADGVAIVVVRSEEDGLDLIYALPQPHLDTEGSAIVFLHAQPAALPDSTLPYHTVHLNTDGSDFDHPKLGWLSVSPMVHAAAARGDIPEFVIGSKSRPGSKILSLTLVNYDDVVKIQSDGGLLNKHGDLMLRICTEEEVESDNIGINLDYSIVVTFPAGTKPAAAAAALTKVFDAAGVPKDGPYRKVMVLFADKRGICMRLIVPGEKEFLAVLGMSGPATPFGNTLLVFSASKRSKVGATPVADAKIIVSRVQQALAAVLQVVLLLSSGAL